MSGGPHGGMADYTYLDDLGNPGLTKFAISEGFGAVDITGAKGRFIYVGDKSRRLKPPLGVAFSYWG